MLENSIYSVSTPEAASSILYKDASRSGEAAEAMKITADHIFNLGVIDEIIPEPRGGAHRDVNTVAETIKQTLMKHLQELTVLTENELVEDRYKKFRKIGRFTYIQEGNHA
jgi:acetyl-CoA carboxylase carboxyl transferase subunit alpha